MDWTTPITVENNTKIVYLIGSMEAPAENDGGVGWRQYLTPRLNWRGIYCFDPTFEEKAKIGMPTPEFMVKLNELVLNEDWTEFILQMRKVWKGRTYMQQLRGREVMLHILGDIQYVEASDFLVWHHKEGDKPGGTLAELIIAWMRGIPVYLITEMSPSKLNKSILYFLLDSGHEQGRIFKTFDEFLTFIDTKYNLKENQCNQ